MVIVKLMGGLGNQMFQYALARHISMRHNSELKMDLSFLLDRTPRDNFVYRDYDLGIFNVVESFATIDDVRKIINTKSSGIKNKIIKISKSFKINLEPKNVAEDGIFYNYGKFYPSILDQAGDIYLDGYWQSENYFKDIESVIRKDFSFKESFDERVSDLANTISLHNSVFVNIRRGDFVNNAFHGTLGNDYYFDAVKKMKEKIKDPVFYVFSDDIDWCKQNLDLGCELNFIGHDFAGVKFSSYLHLMSLCKHSVIANSSFAWWAAWLNANPEKIVIAPKQWYADENANKCDIVPESWIRM